MKIIVVMPTYSAARTLEKTYFGLPEPLRKHVVLGDNQSSDGTNALAKQLGIEVIRHDKNYGYGGNLKRLFRHAINQGADIIVELHPDFQYDPRLIDLLVAYIQRGYFDVMQGNRIRSRDEAMNGGMQWYRYYGNRILSSFENMWFGVNLGEWHSGMKAYRADVLAQLPFEAYPDSHAFANDILMDCIMKGFRVGEIPIPVRYNADSTSISVLNLFRYSFELVWAALQRPRWKKKRFGSASLPALSLDTDSDRDASPLEGAHKGI